MASPHAVGVAALIVSRFGRKDRANRGLTLDPRRTEGLLAGTATDTPCQPGGSYTDTRILVSGAIRTTMHTCQGMLDRNGFYGEGIVNALTAVG